MYGNDEYDDYEYDYNQMHTGDPITDMEYERYGQYSIPKEVEKFIVYFRDAINEGNILDIQNLYENTYPSLCEKYYEKKEWPSYNSISHLFDHDLVFQILYNELYYRHIHACVPKNNSYEVRRDAFKNYLSFFNLIINTEKPVTLELPDIWLWEFVDEFIYQYQNSTHYCSRASDKSEEELRIIIENNSHIYILYILNVLHTLVDKSNIKAQLEVEVAGGDPDSVAGVFGSLPLYKMLGYFSLIALLRLQTILGDYYSAIKVLEPIEVNKFSKFSRIPACQISTSYYVGFAFMMMRRYSDAIRIFSSILLYIQRTKQLYNSRSYQNDQINKQNDQMYHLLAICLVLHPQCIDESLQQVLRDKNYHENMYKMQLRDLDVFRNFFHFGAPKFISPYSPPYEVEIRDYHKDAINHQTEVFMEEIKQQIELPSIRSYLKLYTTLPLEKLESFMVKNKDDEKIANNLLTHLLSFKHKMKNIVWTKGANLEGQFVSGSELDFYIDNDMVHIADTKVSHRYGDFFIRKILKFEDLNRRLHKFKV